MKIKELEKNLDVETKRLIEVSREILRLSKESETSEASKKCEELTPYEQAFLVNPYISPTNYRFTSYTD